MTQPPDFTGATLNFDEFHPLDHSVRDCVGYPGGVRRHLEMRWSFQWRDRLYRRTVCRLGWHEPVLMWQFSTVDDEWNSLRACRACLEKMPTTS